MTDRRIQINQQDWIKWIQSFGVDDGIGYIPRLPIGIPVLANLLSMTQEALQDRLKEFFPDVAIVNAHAIPPLIGQFGATNNEYPNLYHRTHKDPFFPDEYITDIETGT